MFRSGDIESWGRGYKRIIDAINAYKLLPPTLEMLSGLMIAYYSNVRSQLKAQKVDEKYIPIIEYVVQNGRITNSDVQSMLNVSKTTAYRLLNQLDDWLEINGITGKGTYYTLKGFIKGSRFYNYFIYIFCNNLIIKYIAFMYIASQTLHKGFTKGS